MAFIHKVIFNSFKTIAIMNYLVTDYETIIFFNFVQGMNLDLKPLYTPRIKYWKKIT